MTLSELYKPHVSLQSVILRRGIRIVACLIIASIIASFMHYSHSFWIPLTVVIIIQPTIGGTLRKGLQRSIGTIIGILLGGLLLWLAGDDLYIKAVLLLLAIFIAYYSQAFNQVNYGIFVIPLTMMVVLLLASLIPQNIPDMLVERCTDTVAATMLVVLISYLLLPNSTQHEAISAICQVRHTIAELIDAIIEQNITPLEYHQRVLAVIQTNQRLWPEWIYETYFNRNNRVLYQQVVYNSEICFETLAALKWQLVHAKPEKRQTLVKLLTALKQEFSTQLSASSSTLPKVQFDIKSLPKPEQLYFTRLQQAAKKLVSLETQINNLQ